MQYFLVRIASACVSISKSMSIRPAIWAHQAFHYPDQKAACGLQAYNRSLPKGCNRKGQESGKPRRACVELIDRRRDNKGT
jgi:hypothetical protein